jgi:hypothetical protein
MAEGLYQLYGLDAPRLYRAHLGHEQLTTSVNMLREVRYKAPLGDAGNYPDVAIAFIAGFYVNVENTLQSFCPVPR